MALIKELKLQIGSWVSGHRKVHQWCHCRQLRGSRMVASVGKGAGRVRIFFFPKRNNEKQNNKA